MAFTIGRAGKTLALPDPMSWANASYGSAIRGQGGDIVVQGMISGLTAAQALVVRDQLLGYQDNQDEQVVPVVVDSEPRLTGYYRVTGVQVNTEPTGVGYGIIPYTVGLQPVMGFALPALECLISGALLTNGVGAVAADAMPFHAVPGALATANDYLANPAVAGGNWYSRVSADGTLIWGNWTTNFSGTARYTSTPPNFYIGAAMFEQGASLQPVVGRVMAQSDVVNWRLANGLVRVTPNATPCKLDFSWYNGASWSAVKTFHLVNVGVFNAWNSIAVLRNSVEETIIRLSMDQNSGTPAGLWTVDIALRRGDRIVRLYVSGPNTGGWKLVRSTAEAATAITFGGVTLGGIRATANDGASNRYVIFTYQGAGPTNDLINGGITQGGAATSIDFAIGSIIGGSAALIPDRAQDLAGQYLAAQSETQRIVAR